MKNKEKRLEELRKRSQRANFIRADLLRGLAVHEALHNLAADKAIPFTVLHAASDLVTGKLPAVLANRLTRKQIDDYKFVLASVQKQEERQVKNLLADWIDFSGLEKGE